MVGNQVFDGYFLSTNSRAVTLGQISFEQIEELLEQNDRPLRIYSPKGTLLDTIYSLKDYQKLFFEEGISVKGSADPVYSTEEQLLEGLDPLVVLGDVSDYATPVSLEEQAPRIDSTPASGTEALLNKRPEETERPVSTPEETRLQIQFNETPKNLRSSPEISVVGNVRELEDEGSKDYKMTKSSSNAIPQFPGGMNALTQYLNKHTQYPVEAKENQVTGVVYVSFLVDPNGLIHSPKIIRGLGFGCDREVLRLLSQMPSWKAAQHKGTSIEMSYTLSVPFPPQ